MTVEIIAEVAQGFEGNPKLAELLARGAVRAGADAVKYQLVFADEICTPAYPYYDLFRSLEMDATIWECVADIVLSAGKSLYFDVYGDTSIEWAKRLNASGVKISATDFHNEPLIKKALSTFEKVYISLGGASVDEIDALVMGMGRTSGVVFMYGFQAEPTPIDRNNLLRLAELRKRYRGVSIGFMDHSDGESEEAFYLPVMALAMGVNCIEKHITLDRVLKLEDYVSALEPGRFAEFVRVVRTMESALGVSDFALTATELEYRNKANKVVVAAEDLPAGAILQESDLILKRVSLTGVAGGFLRIGDAVGRRLQTDLGKNMPVTGDSICPES